MLSSQIDTAISEGTAGRTGWSDTMRTALLYLILVGLPVLGILELLHVGQGLSAPISLAGKWNAHLVPQNPRALAGEDSLLLPGPITLTITQSGPNLLLTFEEDPKTTFVGNIRDVTIDAGMIREGATAPRTSNGAIPIYFHARVERQTEPDSLVGVLIFEDGPSRTEVPLTAMRQGEVRNATRGQ